MAKKRVMKKVSTTISAPRRVPLGVEILAILVWISAALTIILALLAFTGSTVIDTILSNVSPENLSWSGVGTAVLIFIGLILLLCAVLDYFIGKALWQGKNWARILILIISALGFIDSFNPFRVVGLIINGIIIWYLGFYKPAVNFFK